MTETALPQHDALAEQAGRWLEQVADGDRDAFASLYAATSATLLGICLRVLSDRAEAEEVLQDVFVTVWGKAGQFDRDRARAMTWLGAIARNRAIDRLRAAPAAQRADIDIAEIFADPAPSPAQQAQTASEHALLEDCLDQLEPARATMIRTAFFDSVTYEQLAERSGSPLGTVKSWIRRGLMQLRSCLER